MSGAYYVSYDTETDLITEGVPYPPMVCAQFSSFEADGSVRPATILSARVDREALRSYLRQVLEDPNCYFIGIKIDFDMVVTCLEFPELEPLVWAAYAAHRVFPLDTAQKLYALQEWGTIEEDPTDSSSRKVGFSMDDLNVYYRGPEASRKEEKLGTVRTSYGMLKDWPVSQWPENARRYAALDAEDPLHILAAMQTRRGPLPTATPLRAKKSFGLAWITHNGMCTHKENLLKIQEHVDAELDIANYPRLVQAGIVIPALPPRLSFSIRYDHQPSCERKQGAPECSCPIKSKTPRKAHREDCLDKKNCDCPQAMVAGTSETKKTEPLRDLVLQVARLACEQGEKVNLDLTKGGRAEYELIYGKKIFSARATHEMWDEHPKWLACDSDTIRMLSAFSPTLGEMARRNETMKLRTDYLHKFWWDRHHNIPKKVVEEQLNKAPENREIGFDESKVDLQVVPRMRFSFKDIVRSGRVGSYGDKLFASMNGQNPDPRVRLALQSDPGYVAYSTDYSGVELCAVAWRCESLGIPSVLAELIRARKDTHGYLGASLAREMAKDAPGSFDRSLQGMELLEHFMEFKGSSDHDWWKIWRTFAKPVGLGSWGALAKATMAITAHSAPYYLDFVTPDMCAQGLEIWRRAFPEQKAYFNYVRTNLLDAQHSGGKDDEGRTKRRYRVELPGGLVRANASWTEATNGFGLQGPTAVGAGEAIFNVSRACRDWTLQDPAYGAMLLDFLHDECVYQCPIRADFAETDAMRKSIEQHMVAGMERVMPGMPFRVETAAMYIWDKFAPEVETPEGWAVPAHPRDREITVKKK